MRLGIASAVKQLETPPARNIVSRIVERSYAKGAIRPTEAVRDLGKSLSCASEHPLMNRAMVAVSSHAAESPLDGNVHICAAGKRRGCRVGRVEGADVSDRVEAEGDVFIGCLATRRDSQNDRGASDAEIECHGNTLPCTESKCWKPSERD
jgi:hypothetical protein